MLLEFIVNGDRWATVRQFDDCDYYAVSVGPRTCYWPTLAGALSYARECVGL